MKWLSNTRNCCPDTCNVRLGSLRVFLQFLSNKDIAYLYLYQESKLVKRKKCFKKKVEGLTRNAVTAILNEADLSTKTGRRDYTLLMMMYGTAARIGEILGIKIRHLNLDCSKPFHENLNTTMKYLDITTEEKIKALATLETEEEHNTPKKWRNNEASLSAFLGLAR